MTEKVKVTMDVETCGCKTCVEWRRSRDTALKVSPAQRIGGGHQPEIDPEAPKPDPGKLPPPKGGSSVMPPSSEESDRKAWDGIMGKMADWRAELDSAHEWKSRLDEMDKSIRAELGVRCTRIEKGLRAGLAATINDFRAELIDALKSGDGKKARKDRRFQKAQAAERMSFDERENDVRNTAILWAAQIHEGYGLRDSSQMAQRLRELLGHGQEDPSSPKEE